MSPSLLHFPQRASVSSELQSEAASSPLPRGTCSGLAGSRAAPITPAGHAKIRDPRSEPQGTAGSLELASRRLFEVASPENNTII